MTKKPVKAPKPPKRDPKKWYVAKLENGNTVRVPTYGHMLDAAAQQNTRIRDYDIVEE